MGVARITKMLLYDSLFNSRLEHVFMRYALWILIGTLALTSQLGYAQEPAQPGNSPELKHDAAEKAARAALIGSRFWIVPNPQALIRIDFRDANGNQPGKPFVLNEATDFEVTGYATQYSMRYVKLTFSGGKQAFLSESPGFWRNPRKETMFEHIYIPGKEERYNFREYLLTSSPAETQARERPRHQLEIKRPPGPPYIGMSEKAARESLWGEPRRVHKTVTSRGVFEQWVYTEGYLYFENGVLTAIQN